MSRNILPEDFASQQTLLAKIAAKQRIDGATSVLTPFLIQENIDLPNALLAGQKAALHEETRQQLTGTSEAQRRLRDNTFNPVFTTLLAFVQFLKKLYKSNPKELTAWGVTIDTNGKISYPPAFDNRAKLVTTFIAKHNSYAVGNSPLQPYITANEVAIAKLTAATTKAITAHQQFADNATLATLETSLRDTIWIPIFKNIKAIAAYLISLYTSNPKTVTAWGFDIVDAAAATAIRTSTLKAAESITSTSIVIGGAFTNTGTGNLHVYKGKAITSTPTIVQPNEKLGMVKGYSIITVVNPSTLINGKFTVLVNR